MAFAIELLREINILDRTMPHGHWVAGSSPAMTIESEPVGTEVRRAEFNTVVVQGNTVKHALQSTP